LASKTASDGQSPSEDSSSGGGDGSGGDGGDDDDDVDAGRGFAKPEYLPCSLDPASSTLQPKPCTDTLNDDLYTVYP